MTSNTIQQPKVRQNLRRPARRPAAPSPALDAPQRLQPNNWPRPTTTDPTMDQLAPVFRGRKRLGSQFVSPTQSLGGGRR